MDLLPLEHFGTFDAVAQATSLVLVTVLPIVPVIVRRRARLSA